jgi:Flp pilus assembly protein TadB
MLSDHERKALHEVERHCMAEDPAFTRSFEERQTQPSRRRPQTRAVIATVVAMLLTALMLIAGSLAGALAFASATGLSWAARPCGCVGG